MAFAVNADSSATGLPNAEALDQEFLREMAIMGRQRLDDYRIAENYYAGNQDTMLTDRAKTYLERSGIDYHENYCATVVDALADRCRVVGIDTPEYPELGEWLWKTIWDGNRLDAEQHRFHTELIKYGDAFMVLEFDNSYGTPRIRMNYPDMIRADYVDGKMTRAVKVWTTDEASPVNPPVGVSPRGRSVTRMNIFYDDRIEKYFRAGADEGALWAPWIDYGDTVFPTPNFHNDDPSMPAGIPIIHFANMRQRKQYGIAEHRSTIPQQDRLNKELVDLSLVMDTLGFPQRYAVGVANTSVLRAVPGEVWSSEDPNTAFGQFPAADVDGMIRAIENTISRIAARSRTPSHMLLVSGGAPSGESLKTAESGIVAKAKARQYEWGEAWAHALRYAAILANQYSPPAHRFPINHHDLMETPINVQWADPESRNEKEHLETLGMMAALGVSQRTILSKLEGIDPMTELANASDEQGTSVEALAQAVDRGAMGIG
jgi:hypothetical protein